MQKITRLKINRFINRLVSFGLRRTYTIHSVDEKEYKMVRIMNTYDSYREACDEMVSLVTNNITEYEVLKKYNTKGI